MHGKRRHAALGWAVWKGGSRVAKKKAHQNRVKLGAAGVVALALIGGLTAARMGS
ncbi:MAG TPA: hypothetical protein VH300_13775 [Thermoleophilaceae bacterium]|jgi:hypothetical protein|nr:hypothetical protein [Thermoleophilaceae bacterium]